MSIRPSADLVKGQRLPGAFEVLDSAFVFFGGGSRTESAQVLAPSGLRIFLPRIQPILAGFQFPYHAFFRATEAPRAVRQIHTSQPDESNAKIDPTNRYFWRMNRQRMDAEELRDSALAMAGTLNLKMGGRPVIPPLTGEEKTGMWALLSVSDVGHL